MSHPEPENTRAIQDRDEAGRFVPGQSGNRKGKPKGARNKTTRAAMALLSNEGEEITRKAIELAKGGDTTALRLCLERIAPPIREAAIEGLSLPPITGAADLPAVLATLLQAVGDGTVTPGEAERLAKLIGEFGRSIELADFEARLASLEKILEVQK